MNWITPLMMFTIFVFYIMSASTSCTHTAHTRIGELTYCNWETACVCYLTHLRTAVKPFHGALSNGQPSSLTYLLTEMSIDCRRWVNISKKLINTTVGRTYYRVVLGFPGLDCYASTANNDRLAVGTISPRFCKYTRNRCACKWTFFPPTGCAWLPTVIAKRCETTHAEVSEAGPAFWQKQNPFSGTYLRVSYSVNQRLSVCGRWKIDKTLTTIQLCIWVWINLNPFFYPLVVASLSNRRALVLIGLNVVLSLSVLYAPPHPAALCDRLTN